MAAASNSVVNAMSGEDEDAMLLARSSLRILRPRSLELLGQMLNARRVLPTVDGRLRDWRGLAEEAGLTAEETRRAEVSAGGGEDFKTAFSVGWVLYACACCRSYARRGVQVVPPARGRHGGRAGAGAAPHRPPRRAG